MKWNTSQQQLLLTTTYPYRKEEIMEKKTTHELVEILKINYAI